MTQELFLDKSAVMGGGLMGSQIALVLAMGSKETVLMSLRQETVDKAMENIHRYAGGSHFFQPAHIVPVLEVIRGQKTSDEAMDRSCEIWERLGRTTLKVQKDGPGFLVNRLQHAIIREAVHLLVTGVADAESIDLAVELGLAPRFTTAGPL